MTLYVTITFGNDRTARGRYETDDPVEAVKQALAKVNLSPTREFAGATVLGILIEEQGTQLTREDVAEQFEVLRTKESRRAAGLPVEDAEPNPEPRPEIDPADLPLPE